MRNSRSDAFDRALDANHQDAKRWRDVASDPSFPDALARRADVLRASWRPPITDRIRFLEDRCRGRRVLDIGCVAHDPARMSSPLWLHGRLAATAAVCVGVDVMSDGVELMRERGYVVELHDLHDGLGPLARHAPFDVVVTGELIEHVESLSMLFTVAVDALVPGGELVVTTPNPYAPHRVWAGQRGMVWENTDHILYAFPSGMVELAERHGLVLTEAAVTKKPVRWRPVELAREARRKVRGTAWVRMGYSTDGERLVRRVKGERWARLTASWAPRRRFLGDTFVYVIRRPDAGPG